MFCETSRCECQGTDSDGWHHRGLCFSSPSLTTLFFFLLSLLRACSAPRLPLPPAHPTPSVKYRLAAGYNLQIAPTHPVFHIFMFFVFINSGVGSGRVVPLRWRAFHCLRHAKAEDARSEERADLPAISAAAFPSCIVLARSIAFPFSADRLLLFQGDSKGGRSLKAE